MRRSYSLRSAMKVIKLLASARTKEQLAEKQRLVIAGAEGVLEEYPPN